MRKVRQTPKVFLSLSLLCCLLGVPISANGKPPDQVRPLPKSQTSRVKQREAEPARKGKKAVPPVQSAQGKLKASPASVAKAGKTNPTSAKSKSQVAKNTKGKTTETACGECVRTTSRTAAKATSPKNAKPTASTLSKATAAKTSQVAAAKPLSSRLVQASYTPAASGETRGKFGKAGPKTLPAADEETKEKIVTVAPPRARVAPPTRAAEPRAAEISRAATTRNNVDDEAGDEQKTTRRSSEIADGDATAEYKIAYPDQIEVVEFGSTSPTVQNLLTLQTTRPLTPFGAVVTRSSSVPNKRSDINIPQQRILEIQYQLANRGFYNTEPNGVYDQATIQAMWEFQKNYGLPATGYPTAHALKRLGLN
jgi:hypothetical protein